jgi:competence protein ComEA
MSSLSRSQLVVYAAIAVALLLIGARWIRGASERGSDPGGVAFASEGGTPDSGAGGVEVSGGEDAVVHVAGAVRDPGVYRLPAGARVTDAVERAGGPAAGASLDAINLAARLADGQQVVVPSKAGSAASASAAVGSTDGPISLGSATLEQLDTIEGIGPVTAQDILDYRDEHGGLSSIEELDEVSGIGPATMDSLRERLQP